MFGNQLVKKKKTFQHYTSLELCAAVCVKHAQTIISAYTSFAAGSTWFHVATASVELQGDAGEDSMPLAAPSIYLHNDDILWRKKENGGLVCGEAGESFMRINGIIK